MNLSSRHRLLVAIVAGCAIAQSSIAPCAPLPAVAQAEVAHLLGFVESSGCEFFRNGTWHDSRAAREHLSMKFEYMAKSNMLQSAEDFIGKAATSSSMSGGAYKVRCSGGPTMTSAEWLRGELARYRRPAIKTSGQSSAS